MEIVFIYLHFKIAFCYAPSYLEMDTVFNCLQFEIASIAIMLPWNGNSIQLSQFRDSMFTILVISKWYIVWLVCYLSRNGDSYILYTFRGRSSSKDSYLEMEIVEYYLYFEIAWFLYKLSWNEYCLHFEIARSIANMLSRNGNSSIQSSFRDS